MSMTDAQEEVSIQEIELQMEAYKEAIDRADALQRLQQNPDFKLIIEEGLFEKKPAQLVSLKAAPGQQDPESQARIIKDMDSIGFLQQHFNMIFAFGNAAHEALDQAREAVAEMEQEGLDESGGLH